MRINPQPIKHVAQAVAESRVTLSPGDTQVALMYISGVPIDLICRAMHCTPEAIQAILDSEDMQEFLTQASFMIARTVKGTKDRLELLLPRATDTLSQAMIHGKPETQLKAALAVLDRNGYSAVQRIHHSSGPQISKDQAELLRLAVAECAMEVVLPRSSAPTLPSPSQPPDGGSLVLEKAV